MPISRHIADYLPNIITAVFCGTLSLMCLSPPENADILHSEQVLYKTSSGPPSTRPPPPVSLPSARRAMNNEARRADSLHTLHCEHNHSCLCPAALHPSSHSHSPPPTLQIQYFFWMGVHISLFFSLFYSLSHTPTLTYSHSFLCLTSLSPSLLEMIARFDDICSSFQLSRF